MNYVPLLSADNDANCETAKDIERQLPKWMVVWGIYSRQFVAFPLFAAPAGTIVTGSYPPAVINRMQEIENGDQSALIRPCISHARTTDGAQGASR